MVDSSALLEQCAPEVPAHLMHALVRVESAWRPLAIGLDAGVRGTRGVRQPQTLGQAVAQAEALTSAGRGFSVGLAQIHMSNVTRYGLSWAQAFDPCLNLAAGQRILQGFYRDARAAGYAGLAATHAALRGYNAGAIDRVASAGYASRVVALAQGDPSALQATAQARPYGFRTLMSAGFPRESSNSPPAPSATRSPQGEALDIFARRSAVPGF